MCTCAAGWEGFDCEIDTDECAPNLGLGNCLNGATCDDSNSDALIAVDTYVCTCAAGYEGTHCETDIDECLSTNNANFPQLCNTTGTYTCDTFGGNNTRNCNCNPGFNGSRCEIDINECSPNPCLAGVCTETSDGTTPAYDSFHCLCPPGITGTTCEIDIDECNTTTVRFPELCNTTGTETCDTLGGIDSRNCNCYAGYEGPLCEIDINECSPNPCRSASTTTCTETTDGVTFAINEYHCACLAGWIGKNCETLEKKLRLQAPEVAYATWAYVLQGLAAVGFVAFGVSQVSAGEQITRYVSGKPEGGLGCCDSFWRAAAKHSKRGRRYRVIE